MKPVGTVLVVDLMPDGNFAFRLQPRLIAAGPDEIGAFGVLLSDIVDQVANAYKPTGVPAELLRGAILEIFEAENSAKDADPSRREDHGAWPANVN